MTIRLILARHGNTFEKGEKPVQVGIKTDKPLTAEGKSQARTLGNYFLHNSIIPSSIYSGSLKRQVETATLVAEQLHFQGKIHTHEHALDEIDYGSWEGLSQEEIIEKWPEEYRAWTETASWPSHLFANSLDHHKKEIEKWINTLKMRYKQGDTVLAITSNGIIRFFYALNTSAWDQCLQEKKMEMLKVKTGNLCELAIPLEKNSPIEIVRWNVHPIDLNL